METNTALARRCIAATGAGQRCAINADRNRAMTQQSNCGGKSIIEMLWDELDVWYAKLMPPDGEFAGFGEADAQRSQAKGVCLGIATSLAYLRNPYRPDVNAIKVEAHERWEARR